MSYALNPFPSVEGWEDMKRAAYSALKCRQFPNEEIVELMGEPAPRRRGRRQVYRQLAAHAIGMQKFDGLSMREVAERLQPRDYPKHSTPFRKRLERDATRLRSRMRAAKQFLDRSSTIH